MSKIAPLLKDFVEDVPDSDKAGYAASIANLYIANQQTDLDNKKADAAARKFLSQRLLGISAAWLALTAAVIFFEAYGAWGFRLGSATMIAFITTSLATVTGLWGIALRYFFRASDA